MTHVQALNALSTGEMCRGRGGVRGVIIAVSQKRPSGVTANGTPWCSGDMFRTCTLLGFGKSGGTVYEFLIEDVMTEDEYQESKEAEQNG